MGMQNKLNFNDKTIISIPLFCLIITIGSIVSFAVSGTKKISNVDNEIEKLKKEIIVLKAFDEKQLLINEKSDKTDEEIKISLQELKTDSKWIIQLLQEQRENSN